MNREYIIYDFTTARDGMEDAVPDIDGFGLWCRVDETYEVPIYNRNDHGMWFSCVQDCSSFASRELDPQFYDIVRFITLSDGAIPISDAGVDDIPAEERELVESIHAMVSAGAVPPEMDDLIQYCFDQEGGDTTGDAA